MSLLGNPVRLPEPLHLLLVPVVVKLGYPVLIDAADSLTTGLLVNLPDKRVDMV
jgi:hypothetical protein